MERMKGSKGLIGWFNYGLFYLGSVYLGFVWDLCA
jgi:hypothetical protein